MSFLKKLFPTKAQQQLQTSTAAPDIQQNSTGLAAGTLVHTARGLVPIEQLQVGDQVLSKAADGTGELVYKPIAKTIITENVPIFLMEFDHHIDPALSVIDQINLRIDLDDSKLPSPLLVSANHPFWTSNQGWVTAAQLTKQEPMLTHDAKQFVSRKGGVMMVNTKRLSLS